MIYTDFRMIPNTINFIDGKNKINFYGLKLQQNNEIELLRF